MEPASHHCESREAYHQLSRRHASEALPIAARSSATAEDLPEASFAGQQETFLNVEGEDNVIAACKKCYASLFTDRAISYRHEKGFDHLKVALSVSVQRMVRADLAGSGVMFSLDTETGFPDVVVINAAWGLEIYMMCEIPSSILGRFVDESTLTGESMPVDKSDQALSDPQGAGDEDCDFRS